MAWFARHQIALSIAVLFLWTEATAWRLPGDSSYDLMNYHLYGPFALLHGKGAFDIAPAQSQGFLAPTNDLFYALLARNVWNVHWLNLLLALPAVAALCVAFAITLRLLDRPTVQGRLLALVAVAIGATGAAAHPVLATSMSDMIPCTLTLSSFALLLRGPAALSASPRPALWAGLLAGAAVGLKLTLGYAAAGLLAALVLRLDLSWRARARTVILFAAATAIGLLAVAGWWWWHLFSLTGNPLFPLYNNLFHSPLAPPGDFVDVRFFPRDLLHWLFDPFFWAVSRTPLVTEPDQPMRDARIALALLAALAILVRRSKDPASALRHMAATFFIGSFALWQWEFSIFRYLSALELLSGPLLATAAIAVGPRVGPAVLLALAILLLAVLRFSTIDPNWGRIGRQGGHPLVVHVPRLPDDSVVLILDNAPLAYVAVFEPPRVCFLGVNNNLTRPRDGGLLQSRIRAIVGSHPTHLYGLEKPDFAPGMADDALHAYRLQRRRCVLVTGAIVGTETRLCALAPTSSL